MKTVGERLKELREDKDYPQKVIADLLGVQRPNYSRIENNHQNLNHKQIIVLCEFLDVSADFLLNLNVNNKKTISTSEELEIHKSLKKIQDIISK